MQRRHAGRGCRARHRAAVRAVQVAHTGSRYVWTVRDGRAVRTEVVAGALTARGAVILAGLRSGDRVITEGAHKVGEGTKVEEL